MPERVKAAQSVSDIIKRYPISNTLTVWSIARDLLDGRDSDASNAAFTLLLGCVASDALSPVERKVFFDSISGSHNTVRLESRFEALVALTKGGRNVEALESDLPESLASLLEACFHAVSKARKREKKLRTDAIAQEEKLFADLFQYISDVAKYNSKIFSDDELELMFARIISICKTTNSQTDISGSLELIDALITYTHVPVNGIPPCVQLLCDIYKQIESLRKPVWTTLKDLFGSHLASPTIFALLDTMHGTQDGRTTHPSARGAFLILTKVIRRGHKPKIPSVPWDLFVQACKGSLAIDNPEYFAEMIKFYSDALSSDDLSQQLLEDADWPELIALILQCGSISRIFAGSTDTATTDQSSFLLVPIQNSMPDESERDALADALIIFAQKLNLLFHRMDFVPKASAIDFFLHLEPLVSTSTIQTILNHYESERLLWLSSPGWLEACRFFIDRLLKDRSRPSAMRVRMIKMLREVYDTASNVPGDSDIEVLPSLILDCIPLEDDPVVLDELGDFATDITRLASEELFQRVLDVVKSTILKPADVTVPDRVSVPLTSPEILGSTENVLTRALVRMFTRNVDLATWKTQCLYDTLLDIAGQENCQSDARIGALRLLSRLRSDAHCAIYVNGPSESEEIAAIFSTTAKTVMSEIIEGEIIQTSRLRSDRASPGPEQRKVSGELSHPPLSRNKSMRADIPASPLWLAGPRGLPEEPCGQSSRVLFSSLTLDKGTNQEETQVLKIDKWLDLVISILNRDGANGEIYTYTLVHLGAQLANGTIFAAAAPQIQALRCLLCEQIKTLSSRDPHRSAPFRKADVAVCMYHILTMLISYHDNFSKAEEDDIVRTFLLGIGTWESASNWCIHALALACHELSASVSKSLETILQKMSQIITQSRVQMHVLEFLAGLSRLPELYKNFREDDYRMVFGICFRFLQSSRDDRDKRKTASPPPFKPGQGALRHSAGSRDLNALSESNAKGFPTSATSSDLPQYVYALAHHVISFWFFCLKLDDRAKYVPWITKNLTYTEGAATAEREVIEEQGLVTIDMMQRTAHTDRDETTRREDFAKPSDGEVSKKSWIVGSSILTIETAGRTGVSQITTRRPVSLKRQSSSTESNRTIVFNEIRGASTAPFAPPSPPDTFDYGP